MSIGICCLIGEVCAVIKLRSSLIGQTNHAITVVIYIVLAAQRKGR